MSVPEDHTSAAQDRGTFLKTLPRLANVLTDVSIAAPTRFAAICDIARHCFPPIAVEGLQALSSEAPAPGALQLPATSVATEAAAAAVVSAGGADSDDDDDADDDQDAADALATSGAGASSAHSPSGEPPLSGGPRTESAAAVGARASVALATAWDSVLHKPVLSRLGDASDRVREGAAVLVGLFLGLDGAVFDLSETLPFLLPALLERCCGSLGYDPQEHVFIEDMAGELLQSHAWLFAAYALCRATGVVSGHSMRPRGSALLAPSQRMRPTAGDASSTRTKTAPSAWPSRRRRPG